MGLDWLSCRVRSVAEKTLNAPAKQGSRLIVEENEKVFLMTNPFTPNDRMAINKADIATKGTRKVSMMPPSLINALKQDELLDLLAYLVSGGNQVDKMFQK